MYIRNSLLACIAFLASSITMLYAAPCYTDVAGGCEGNENEIFIKTAAPPVSTGKDMLCTTDADGSPHCSGYRVPLQNAPSLTNASKPHQAYPTNPPVVINNITYNTIYSETETQQQEPTVVQSPRQIYWQGYYQGYNNQSFYRHGYRPRPPPRPFINNNYRRPIQGISVGRGNVRLTSPNIYNPNRPNMGRPRPPMHRPPMHNNRPPQHNQNMRPPSNNHIQGRPFRSR